MAIIAIADVVTPEIYEEYMEERWTNKSAFWKSGIVAEDPKMNALLDGGATTFNFPFWKVNDMQNQEAQSVNEGGTLTSQKITSGTQIARRLFFEQAWGKNDLVVVQAGDDPIEAVLNKLGDYWDKQYQDALFASVQGVIADNVANDSSDMVEDITGASTTTINSDDIIDTIGKFGDADSDIVAIGMHSVPYNTLRKLNLIDTEPTNTQDIGWGAYMGKTVVVDDALLVSGVYWTVIFKNAAFMSGFSGQGYTQAETDRTPATSGGETNFYTRRVLAMHPAGFAWVEGSITRTYPNFTDMKSADHWNRVASSIKNTGFAVLKSTG